MSNLAMMMGLGSGAGGNNSVEFEGSTSTSQNISVQDIDAFTLSSSNYTIEFWYKPNSTPPSYYVPLAYQWNAAGGTRHIAFAHNTSDRMLVYWYDAGNNYTHTQSIDLNAWNHVALVRTGNTFYVFINGNRETAGSASVSYSNVSLPIIIGNSYSSSGTSNLAVDGKISNVRVVVGNAVYTTTFDTDSLTALTNITGTVLLTCQSPDPFVDNSGNATITNNGATASTDSPF